MNSNEVERWEIEEALRISPLLYDAVLDESRWPTALEAIAKFCNAERGATAQIFGFNPIRHYAVHSHGFSESDMARYLAFDDLSDGDPRHERALKLPNKAVHCRQFVTDDEMRTSPIYKEVFEPTNVEYTLGAQVMNEENEFYFVIGAYRGRDRPCFSDVELKRVNLLLPHIRRVGEIYVRLMSTEEKFSRVQGILENLNLAILFTDSIGKIAYCNKAADALLAKNDGLTSVGGNIGHVDAEVSIGLLKDVRDVALSSISGHDKLTRQLAIRRRESSLPLQATVCSLMSVSGVGLDAFLGRGYVAIYIMDPLARYESDEEQLQRVFGLTKAEALVLKDLSVGRSINEIAANTGRAVETVRGHSKNILNKLGVSRQSDLVRMVLNVRDPMGLDDNDR